MKASSHVDLPSSPDHQRQHALTRLASSREHLREALMGPPERARGEDGARDPGGVWAAWWRQARQFTRRQPLATAALAAVRQWWRHHPWRISGEVAWRQAEACVTPTVRRHPLASVGVAALLGAGLWAWRPWRRSWWRRSLPPDRRAPPPRLLAWWVDELCRLPLQALLSEMVLALTRQHSPAADDPPPQGTAPS